MTDEIPMADSDTDLRFSAQEYGALLRLLMVSDPWPTEQIDRRRIVEMLNEEARQRGYKDWTAAYHDFHD